MKESQKKGDLNHRANSAESPVTRTEIVISTLLRAGVLVSLLTIFVGLVLMFVHHPDYLKSSNELHRLTALGTEFPHSIREVAQGLLVFRGQSIIVVGLLLLLATPIFRVAVSIGAFALERDWTYAAITTVVLLVLLLSFLLGKTGG